mmetsp:Transcript_5573/g.7510  ORF Transcript_5573/g.7510 Transcript_5573/m.7510 type:complete len:92 (-) Transcript_5573:640-915(-)
MFKSIIFYSIISGLICATHAILRPVMNEKRQRITKMEYDGFSSECDRPTFDSETTINFVQGRTESFLRRRNQTVGLDVPMASLYQPQSKSD